MASWHPRKLVQWFQAAGPEDEVEPFHQDRVHLDPFGEGQRRAVALTADRRKYTPFRMSDVGNVKIGA
jgi:hypothetical protein